MAAKGCNPFDNVSIEYAFDGDGINDEEFLSDEAAEAFLERDNQDNFVFGDTTIDGYRMADETFQNMTIGGYFRSNQVETTSFLNAFEMLMQLTNLKNYAENVLCSIKSKNNEDFVLTPDFMPADVKGSKPECTQKDVHDKSQNREDVENQNKEEDASCFTAEEPLLLFSNSDYLKVDESLPHFPPFLQNLESSILDAGTSLIDQPTDDIVGSLGLENENRQSNTPSMQIGTVHHASDQNSPSTDYQTLTSALESFSFADTKLDEICSDDKHSVPVTAIEGSQQCSGLFTPHLSTINSSSSSLRSQVHKGDSFHHHGLNQNDLNYVPVTIVDDILRPSNQISSSVSSFSSSSSQVSKGDIAHQGSKEFEFKVPFPPKKDKVAAVSQNDNPPSSQYSQNMSSISMLLSKSIKVDDEEWDFTLSDINQMMEGIDGNMDFDAAFAQVMTNKKEKIKQQKAAAAAEKPTVNPKPSVHFEKDSANNLGSARESGPVQYDRIPVSDTYHSTSSGPKSPPSSIKATMTAATVVPTSLSPDTCRYSSTGLHTTTTTSTTIAGVSVPHFALDSNIRHQLMENIRLDGDQSVSNIDGNNSIISADDSAADVSLLCDNNLTIANNHTVMDFAASTPMYNHRPNARDMGLLRQSAIHHIVTPHRIQEMLDLPSHVDVPEVCCISLSQLVNFTIWNKLRSGVQCTFSINKMVLNGKVVDGCVCPFDFNRRITLRPNSHETLQILFTPTCAGHFYASMGVTAQNLTNSEETRSYEVVLTGQAEFPKLKVWPNSEEIDFGDLVWGSRDHKTIKVQNVGQATVPVRFTVVRTNSPLCSFSFQSSNTNPDVLRSALTSRPPNAIHSVISMPLSGVREGEQATTHSINVYCHIKEMDSATRRYSEACDIFEGVLSMELDSPVPGQKHLTQFKLRVRAGMVKLHLDKSALILSSPPGETKEGTVKVVNSGNISMKVSLDLDPLTDLFHVAPRQMVVDPHAYQLARVSFTPQDHTTVDVRLVLSDEVCINFLPVKGQTRHVTKINASASSISFGGVPTGDQVKKTFKFSLDQDVKVKCFIRQGVASSFQIASEDGKVKDAIEMVMTKGLRSAVHIVFIPQEVKWFTSTLVLQVINGDSFSIPLTGYGGVSSIKFTGVTETSSGENVIPVGTVDGSGSPFTHYVTVTNTGDRCAFVKAVFNDLSHNAMSPHQATVMPSELFLVPQESQEMVLWMLHPPDSDKSSSRSGMSLKGIVKLSYGDEISRQLLRRNQNSECQRHALNYILELTQDQKTILGTEMQNVAGDQSISLNSFKTSVRSKKIGLLAGIDGKALSQPRTSSSADVRPKPSSSVGLGPRPVLQTVSLNVQQQQQPTKMDKEWTLSPVSISFKVLDARSKEFAQIINYTDKELRFSVDTDDCLNVAPVKGMIATKSWCQLEVMTSSKFWSAMKKSSCALIKVKCNEETKHIRVLIEGAAVSEMTFPPVFSAQDTVTAESSGHSVNARGTLGSTVVRGSSSVASASMQAGKSQRLAISSHQQFPVAEGEGIKGIRGPEMAIIPPVSLGGRTEFTYVFTNISQEVISWKALAVGPLSCDPMSQSHSGTLKSSVFCPHPKSGSLEAGGVQTVSLGFTPLSVGSYRQTWGIEYFGVSSTNLHTFTIYAKANSRELQSGTREVPICLSPKRQQQKHQQPQPPSQSHQVSLPQHQQQKHAQPHTAQVMGAADNLPKWTPCQSQSTNASNLRTSSATSAVSEINPAAPVTSMTTSSSAAIAAQKVKRPEESGDSNTDKVRPSDAGRCLKLVEKVLQFSTLSKGRNETLYLLLKNHSLKDADITVEQQPGAPFIIRHTNFIVGTGRMTKLPVTFKPLHVAKFKEQVVIREKHTNATFTATLEAECVP